MNIYVTVGVFFILLCLISTRKSTKVVSLLSYFLFLIVLVGHTGMFVNNNDIPSYIGLYLGRSSELGYLNDRIKEIWIGENTEPMYYLYQKAVGFFFPQTGWAYVIAYGMTVSIPIFMLCNKRKDSTPFTLGILLLGFSGFFFFNILCAQRQMIGNCFMLMANYIILYKNFKHRLLLVTILFILALLSHSSFLITIPLFLIAYFMKFRNKTIVYASLLLSLGLASFSKFSAVAETASDTLNLISASSGFLSDDISHFANLTRDSNLTASFLGLLPMNILGLACAFFYKKEEINTLGAKCLILAMILYNILSSVWLVDRLTLFLFIVGLTIGLPKSISQNFICKISYIVILTGMLLFNALRVYPGGYQLLPYPSII